MANIAEIRTKYPQYDDLSDQQLADALYTKSYSDMPRDQFDQKIGLAVTDASLAAITAEKQKAFWGGSPDPSVVDRARSFGRGILEGVPIVGPALINGQKEAGALLAQIPGGMTPEEVRASYDKDEAFLREKAGNERLAGNVTGAVASMAPLGATAVGGRMLGMTGGLASRVGMGAGSGAVISGADTLARGGSIEDAGKSALLGAGLGSAFPVVAATAKGLGSAAKNALTTAGQVGVDATVSKGIKAAASQLFDNAKFSPVQIAPESYDAFVSGLTRKVAASGLDKTLHPDTYAALTNMLGWRGQALGLKDIHTIRQIAQDASRSAQARDGAKAGQIVDAIDDYIKSLKPSDVVAGHDPRSAANSLLEGISTWSKASKAATIEDALYRAENTASGFENGIRGEFRKMLQNPSTRRLFSKDELQAIETVVRGSQGANLAKLIGKFGFGSGNASNMLGGLAGYSAAASLTPLGPLGALVATAGATGARRVSESMTKRAAQNALDIVATGAPTVRPPLPQSAGSFLRMIDGSAANVPVAPAVPGVLTNRRQPIEVTVNGGSRARP